MSKPCIQGAVSAFVFSLFVSSSQAALISVLGGQAVYDTDLDVTWLANTNLADTTSFGLAGITSNGEMGTTTAVAWLAALNADGGTGWLGISTWRLPTTLLNDPTCEFSSSRGRDCTGSDMGHLFYTDLEGTRSTDINTTGTPELVALFSDLTRRHRSSTPDPQAGRYGFSWNGGSQSFNSITTSQKVMVLFDGGSENVIPIPAAVWLFGSGLLGLIGIARRKKA